MPWNESAFYEVHPDVVEDIQRYHPGLVVEFNPMWSKTWSDHETGRSFSVMDPGSRYYVGQKYLTMAEVDGFSGIACSREAVMPVLYVDQAMELDRRWKDALEESRLENAHKEYERAIEKERKIKREYLEQVYDRAKDEGWWYFRKWSEDFNFGSVTAKDPRRKLEELRQKLGRELKGW